MLFSDERTISPAQVETPGRTLGFWHEIKIHPGRPEWILAKVRRNVCEEWDASTNPQCAYDLFLSQVKTLLQLSKLNYHCAAEVIVGSLLENFGNDVLLIPTISTVQIESGVSRGLGCG